jgi:hypothetical protein
LVRTRSITLSLGLFLITMLVLSCLSTSVFNLYNQALAQQYIPTIKYRNLVIDLGKGVKTNAQLTYPVIGKGPFPGILLVHGAGPADMNYGGMFWQIAQYLSERGFVVLRYDKRGIGGNGTIINSDIGGNMTSNDLIHDAEKGVSVLVQQPEVDAKRKDLLGKAGVNPDSLRTWDGYIAAAKKLNSILRPQGIEGVHLTGASHSPDLWYPYVWMLGGEILKMKSGHPTKGSYWFPAFNSTEGVKAMNFIKQQIDAGIKPQKNHFFESEFLDRKFAVMIEGSWLPVPFLQSQPKKNFEDRIGFIPMLPVPYKNNQTSTLMGGWALSIPKTSIHKDLAWKLMELTLTPKLLNPFLVQGGYLPTQISMGTSDLLNSTALSYPYYRQLVSMIPSAGTRPSIPEYPQIADNIRQAIYEVQFRNKEPKQVLDEAAAKSAMVLGW